MTEARLPAGKLLALLIVLMILIGLAEWWSPVSLRLLYAPLILFGSWNSGRNLGLGLAVSAALISVLPSLVNDSTSLTVFPLLLEFVTRVVMLGGFALLCAELRNAREHGKRIARTDFLTGLLNNAGFQERLNAERNRHARNEHSLTVAYLDADHFKRLNDTRGHRAGDRLLMAVAQILNQTTRNYDGVARLGGDEFGLLLVNTTRETVHPILDRVHHALMQLGAKTDPPVSFSMGAVIFPEFPEEASEMLEQADQQMYVAKNSERGTLSTAVYGEKSSTTPLAIHTEEEP